MESCACKPVSSPAARPRQPTQAGLGLCACQAGGRAPQLPSNGLGVFGPPQAAAIRALAAPSISTQAQAFTALALEIVAFGVKSMIESVYRGMIDKVN